VKRRLALPFLLLLAGCGGSQKPSAPCSIDRGEIPSWATSGFSEAHPRMPHVLSDGGKITAILFGDPLVSPPDKDRANKILWVARDPITVPSDLKIHAVSGSRATDRVLKAGVGPSIVDLPAGCWQLTLSWAGQRDTLDLRYAQAKPSLGGPSRNARAPPVFIPAHAPRGSAMIEQ
jgi:hypothetical protein